MVWLRLRTQLATGFDIRKGSNVVGRVLLVSIMLSPVMQNALWSQSLDRITSTMAWRTSDGLDRLLNFRESEKFRIQQYWVAGQLLVKHPVLGLGHGQFVEWFSKENTVLHVLSHARTTENMFLMIMAETGLLGLVSFLCFLIHSGRQLYLDHSRTSEAVLSAAIGCLVGMMFWDALNFPVVRVLFWSCIGLAMACARPSTQLRSQV